jgi:hypothetical protein
MIVQRVTHSGSTIDIVNLQSGADEVDQATVEDLTERISARQ